MFSFIYFNKKNQYSQMLYDILHFPAAKMSMTRNDYFE